MVAFTSRLVTLAAIIRVAQRSITTRYFAKLSLLDSVCSATKISLIAIFFCFSVFFFSFFFLILVLRRKGKDLVVSRCRREQGETAREHAALATRAPWHVDSCSRQVSSLYLSPFFLVCICIFISLFFLLSILAFPSHCPTIV